MGINHEHVAFDPGLQSLNLCCAWPAPTAGRHEAGSKHLESLPPQLLVVQQPGGAGDLEHHAALVRIGIVATHTIPREDRFDLPMETLRRELPRRCTKRRRLPREGWQTGRRADVSAEAARCEDGCFSSSRHLCWARKGRTFGRIKRLYTTRCAQQEEMYSSLPPPAVPIRNQSTGCTLCCAGFAFRNSAIRPRCNSA